MAGRLADTVVVLTGASSGIGRATAALFGREGADLVLAARREPALHHVAEEVIAAGGRAMSVPCDVRDPVEMARLASRTIDAFGRIDIWINNAGVSAFGRFDEMPPEAFNAVFDTTFFGVVNGVRASLPHFRERRRGSILTVASIAGRIPAPFQAAYHAAKHAVLGFTESVRLELEMDGMSGVHVCNVLPGPVDTPFWQHAGNYSGHEINALPGAVAPEKVARALLSLALKPQREIGVGISATLLETAYALAPGLVERRLRESVRQNLFQDKPRAPGGGSLFRPMPESTGTTGGWRGDGQGARRRYAGAVALAVPIAAAAYYAYSRR